MLRTLRYFAQWSTEFTAGSFVRACFVFCAFFFLFQILGANWLGHPWFALAHSGHSANPLKCESLKIWGAPGFCKLTKRKRYILRARENCKKRNLWYPHCTWAGCFGISEGCSSKLCVSKIFNNADFIKYPIAIVGLISNGDSLVQLATRIADKVCTKGLFKEALRMGQLPGDSHEWL